MTGLTGMNLTQYGSKFQAFSTQNGINTSSLVEMELSILEQKFVPVENQLGYAKTEQAQWKAMSSAMQKFQSSLENMSALTNGNKGVSLSNEGAFSLTATSSAISNDYSIEVNKLATKHKLLTTAQADSTSALNKEGTVKINGKDFEFTNDMSLEDVASALNKGEYGLTASLVSGSLIITAKETGVANKIQFEDSNNILSDLGFINTDGSYRMEIAQAEDAVIKIDGIEVTSGTNKITNALNGVTLELKSTTTSPVETKIGSNDTDLEDQIKAFVKNYNALINTMNEYTGEGKGLQGESIMTRALSQLQSVITEDHKGYFYEIGINFDSVLKDGTLRLDESKLTNAIKNDYNKVLNIFNGESGAVSKLNTHMERLVGDDGSITGKIKTFDESIKKYQETISKYEESYERQKESILNKYVQYEKQMANLNSLTTQIEALIKSWNKSDD